jgi:hypothetical protein
MATPADVALSPEQCLQREIGAYRLAKRYGKFKVPCTARGYFRYSCPEQRFGAARNDADNGQGMLQLWQSGQKVNKMGADEVEALTIEAVQTMATFDLMIGNTDRNKDNMLYVCEGTKAHFVLLDHSLTLLKDGDDLRGALDRNAWLGWPQVASPTLDCVQEIIQTLDAEEDSKILFEEGFNSSSVHALKKRYIVLKEMACSALLSEIATMLYLPGGS